MRGLDIGIAGCGVAGLACAAFLARAGHRVTVFDKLSAPAPVGSGLILQPVGLRALEELGVRSAMEALGAPVTRLFGRSVPSGRVVLDVRYAALGAAVTGLSVHRAALFDVLHEAARTAGAEIVHGKSIVRVEGENGTKQRLVFGDRSTTGPFDLCINALGARSDLSAYGRPLRYGALWANLAWPEGAGFAEDALEQRYDRAERMVGVLPIGRVKEMAPKQAAFFWSLKQDHYTAWRVTPIEFWKREVQRLWPATGAMLDQISSHDDLVFARYAHRTTPRGFGPGVAHVGDSWHCTSPQLGQGANLALLDAWAIARAIETEGDVDNALRAYARMRRTQVLIYQAASWMFTPAYQGDGTILPWIRDRVVGPLSRIWPAPRMLAGLVAGRWGAPLAKILR